MDEKSLFEKNQEYKRNLYNMANEIKRNYPEGAKLLFEISNYLEDMNITISKIVKILK